MARSILVNGLLYYRLFGHLDMTSSKYQMIIPDVISKLREHPLKDFWKLSRPCENFPGLLKTFQFIWKLSRFSDNFSGDLKTFSYLDTFQIVWKLSRLPGKWPVHLRNVHSVWNLSRSSKKPFKVLEWIVEWIVTIFLILRNISETRLRGYGGCAKQDHSAILKEFLKVAKLQRLQWILSIQKKICNKVARLQKLRGLRKAGPFSHFERIPKGCKVTKVTKNFVNSATRLQGYGSYGVALGTTIMSSSKKY